MTDDKQKLLIKLKKSREEITNILNKNGKKYLTLPKKTKKNSK